MFTIEWAKDPVYASQESTTINLMVKFVEMAEVLPFTAAPHDSMPYGVELYNNAVAGMYGPIAPYTPPAPAPGQPEASGVQTL